MSVPGDVMQQFSAPLHMDAPGGAPSGANPMGDMASLTGDLSRLNNEQADVSAQEANVTQQTMQSLQSLNPPKQDHKILDTMPWLIGLVAIGGKATGLHAKTMLGATNGMVQGLLKGQLDAYDRSRQQWEDSRQKLLDTWKLQMEYYNQLYKSYGDRANAKEQAIKLARELNNDQWNHSYKEQMAQQKEGMDEFKAWATTQTLMQKMESLDMKQQFDQMRLQIEKQNADSRTLQANSQADLRRAQIDKVVKTQSGPTATKQIDGMITDLTKQMSALKKKYSDIETMSPEDRQQYDQMFQQMGEWEIARKKLTPVPVSDPSELDGLDDGQHYVTPDGAERVKGGSKQQGGGSPGGSPQAGGTGQVSAPAGGGGGNALQRAGDLSQSFPDPTGG